MKYGRPLTADDEATSAPCASDLPLLPLGLLHMAAVGAAVALGPETVRLINVVALTLTQTLLCSYYATLGRGRLAWRWPLAALLVGCVAAFALGCLAAATPYFSRELSALMIGTLYLLWFAAQVPLWFLRVKFRWCVARGDISHISASREELQFGIKHILAWTAVIAVLCSFARWAFPSAAAIEVRGLVETLVLLVASSTLLCFLPLWAGLARAGRIAWWMLTLTYSVIVVGLEPWLLSLVLGLRHDDGWLLWWLGFVEVASLLASLLLVRAAGFRLVRLAATQGG